jgi:trimeric autotransporter adhesin
MSLHSTIKFIALAGVSALANAAYATQPPCATSDANHDTACGSSALSANTGSKNTAVGADALQSNTIAVGNSAFGAYALSVNDVGGANTAVGTYALAANASGNGNTAIGMYALQSNVMAVGNTATGVSALRSNTTGMDNTASGAQALHNNTTGYSLTAVGSWALTSNYTGISNTALGWQSLYANTTGNNNTASGMSALYGNVNGNYNSAFGYQALKNSQSGLGNIGVGPFAGQNVVQGQLNIDIGSWGTADESNTIRIGLPQYHQHTYIAGIGNSPIAGGTPVVVNPATGQLGYAGSSERYKTEITPIGSTSEKLSQLRPVSFHIKTDPTGAIQYGLIAEEVDKVYPELVIRDNDGKIQGMRYDELAPMLLNEVQKEQATIAAQAAKIAALEQKVTEVDNLKKQLTVVLGELKTQGNLVAQR